MRRWKRRPNKGGGARRPANRSGSFLRSIGTGRRVQVRLECAPPPRAIKHRFGAPGRTRPVDLSQGTNAAEEPPLIFAVDDLAALCRRFRERGIAIVDRGPDQESLEQVYLRAERGLRSAHKRSRRN